MEERDFGSAPILRLYLRCSIPAMVGMGFSAIYSITDGVFVGHFIGHEALAAVNLVMPLVMIITALADMVATGSSVRISILLGQDKRDEANHVFSVCLAVIAGVSAIFGIAGFALAKPLISLMGADGATAEYAVGYFRVFAIFMPLCSVYFSTDNYLRVCGKVRLSMAINIVCSLKRMKKIQRTVMAASAGLSALAMLFLLTYGQYLLPLFIKDGDPALYELSLRALKLYALSYLVRWITSTLSSYMTSVERPWHSIAISVMATLVYPLVFLAILVPLWNLDGVWILHFVAGIFSAVTAIIIVKRVNIPDYPVQPTCLLFKPKPSFGQWRNGMKWG